MDLIHPNSRDEVVRAVERAAASAKRLLVVGGRRHIDKGNPCEVDAELWTTQLDRVVSYEPAEMIAVVEAGMRYSELDTMLAGGGQEWPADAPGDATVGGIIASAASGARRLRTGPIRDTVLEVELVTGDGREVRGGGRVVKNVTGYDLPRLMTGSLGTLAVILQVALKLRPRAKTRATLTFETTQPMGLALELVEAVALPASVLARPGAVDVRLEGWPEEVAAQAEAAADHGGPHTRTDEAVFPSTEIDAPIVAEVSVTPSRLAHLRPRGDWQTLAGVGLAWVGCLDDTELAQLREEVLALGGIAPVIKGPGGLGSAAPAMEIHRRLKRSFDPGNVLAPGRGWGGI